MAANNALRVFTLEQRERAWLALFNKHKGSSGPIFTAFPESGFFNLVRKGLSTNPDKSAAYNAALNYLPNELFPRSQFNGTLDLRRNSLNTVDCFTSLNSINFLELAENKLFNIDGLRNLSSVRGLSLSFNLLKSVAPLSRLVSAEGLSLSSNQLKEVSALSNLSYLGQQLRLDGNALQVLPDNLSQLPDSLLVLPDSIITSAKPQVADLDFD